MLRIALLEEKNLSDIEYKIIKYVNINLSILVEQTIDLINNTSIGLEEIFPIILCNQNSEEYKMLLYTLNNLIKSEFIRPYVKPKYESILYDILKYWQEYYNNCDNNEEFISPLSLDEEFKQELIEYGEDDWIPILSKYENYFDLCFEDLDFTVNVLEPCVLQALKGRDGFIEQLGIDLNDYIGLIPKDLEELYLERTLNLTKASSIDNFIISEFTNILTLFEQRAVDFAKKGEVEISNDIYCAIKRTFDNKEIITVREAQIGFSSKKLGETDLYLYKYENYMRYDLGIIEIKRIEAFKKQYEQLLGYLNPNFSFGVTISINRSKPLGNALNYIQKRIIDLNTDSGKFQVVNVMKSVDSPYYIISEHRLPEMPTKTMKIYHLIFNLNCEPRKHIAKLARSSDT